MRTAAVDVAMPVVGCEGTCRRGGGGGKPEDGLKMAPELGWDGGRIEPGKPGPHPKDKVIFIEGVGGRRDEDEAEDDGGGLAEVLFLLLRPMV